MLTALLFSACSHEFDPFDGATPAAADRVPMTFASVVDSGTVHAKLIMGYQGWFHCPDDGAGRGWTHWAYGEPAPETVTFDAWPDLREFSDDELCETSMSYADGRDAGLFSAYNPATVQRHASWMRQYGIDGVLLQRFTSELRDATAKAARDQVARNVRDASEQYGRVFAMEYDISGAQPDILADQLIEDWKHLVDDLELTTSDRYIHHDGRPLVVIWGFGFTDRNGTPDDALKVIDFFRNPPDPRYGATLMGGVPGEWRSLAGDSQSDPRWATVYRSWDIINPWTVGRFVDDAGADSYRTNYLQPDIAAATAAGAEYMPVVWPGFSWSNLFDGEPLNQIHRNGGSFYWRQVYNAIGAGAPMIFNAMFDEVDEGTAMFKIAENRGQTPSTGSFLTLDADGQSLPSDWYLRVGGAATEMLRGDRPLSSSLPISPSDPAPADPSEPADPTDTGSPPAAEGELSWNELVILRAYHGILGREPDADGYRNWVGAMDGGLDEYDVARGFWESSEFQDDRLPLGAGTVTNFLYEGILGRASDPSGYAATVDAIERGEGALRAGDMLASEEAHTAPQ